MGRGWRKGWKEREREKGGREEHLGGELCSPCD